MRSYLFDQKMIHLRKNLNIDTDKRMEEMPFKALDCSNLQDGSIKIENNQIHIEQSVEGSRYPTGEK